MESELVSKSGLRIAVEGCGHGTLHAIYASIDKACEIKGWDCVDLLIICGDFQSVRNAYDLNCISMPAKYREMHDFHEYYSGARTAPYLTIFVGGNHEASNYLSELYYGGWVAPNIYYMGAANVIRLGSLRIAGLSGIWKGYNYKKSHYERLPYNQDDIKSIYHVRELDTRKLLQLRTQVDVGISHDWPRGIEWKGNWQRLFKKKEHFEVDARAGQLGSVAAKLVLDRLRPPYWFSAHLHVKYAATLNHGKGTETDGETPTGPDLNASVSNGISAPSRENVNDAELNIDGKPEAGQGALSENPAMSINEDARAQLPAAFRRPLQDRSESVSEDLRAQLPAAFRRVPAAHTAKHDPPLPPPPDIVNQTTSFLSLDKCLPNREFLQVLEMLPLAHSEEESSRPLTLEYDKEWLAITRVFANELTFGDPSAAAPAAKSEASYRSQVKQEEQWVEDNIVKHGKLKIPQNFARTAPVYDSAMGPRVRGMPREYSNPQTRAFCTLLQIPNPFHASEEELEQRAQAAPASQDQGERHASGGNGDHGNRGGGWGHRGFGRGTGRGGRGRGWR